MDLRVKKTRTSIINAFIQLRSKKPLEKITVKELAELAMINKATFYLHYKDIYDLSDSLEEELIQNVLNNITDADNFSEQLINGLIAQGELFTILLSDTRNNNFANKLEKEIKKFIFNNSPQYANDKKIDIALSYAIQGSYHAFINNNNTYDTTSIVNILNFINKLITQINFNEILELKI